MYYLFTRCSFVIATLCWKFLCRAFQILTLNMPLTMGWAVRGSNPGGTRFSAPPDRPWGPPSLPYNGYRVFPGGKVLPGRAAEHSPPSSAVVMEEESYISTHPLGHNRACNGNTLPLLAILMTVTLLWKAVFVGASCLVSFCCLSYIFHYTCLLAPTYNMTNFCERNSMVSICTCAPRRAEGASLFFLVLRDPGL
jgi:hypothetical protein